MLRVPGHGFVFVPDPIDVANKLQNLSDLPLGMAGLIRWSRTRMGIYLESVAMTVRQIHPLNDAAEADADLGMRETTGSTVLLL